MLSLRPKFVTFRLWRKLGHQSLMYLRKYISFVSKFFFWQILNHYEEISTSLYRETQAICWCYRKHLIQGNMTKTFFWNAARYAEMVERKGVHSNNETMSCYMLVEVLDYLVAAFRTKCTKKLPYLNILCEITQCLSPISSTTVLYRR